MNLSFSALRGAPSRLLLGLALLAGLTAARLPSVVDEAVGMRNRTAGAQLLDDAARDASGTERAWLQLYAAELHRLAGDADARAAFAAIVEQDPDSPAREPAQLGLAVIDAQAAPSGNTLAALGLFSDKNVPDTLNADRYLLLARARAEAGDADAARSFGAKAEKYAADHKDVSRRVAKGLATLDAPTEPAATKGPADLQAIERVRAAIAAGDLAKAGELGAAFAKDFPDSPFAAEAGWAQRRADGGARPDPLLVAVLLPSSGTYAIPAQSLRTAFELGNEHAGSPVRLAFFDTAGSPDQCVKVLEQAVIRQGASVVLGPLLKDEAAKCAPAAQAMHVPMITLTSSEEVLAAGDQVYRAFPSTEQLVDALVDEAYDVRGLKRYAILAPTTPFGENVTRVFTAAVTSRGGTVNATVTYDPNAKDFRAPAKVLGKKDYKARAGEFSRLRSEAERKRQDPDKVVLPPLIDYDAIFIPDSYQRVALIASALAFEEFPVGRFRAHAEDTPLPLLGLNAWNNDELARRGGNYVLDSIFVDAFDPHGTDAPTNRFVDAWRDRSQADPTVVEAAAYDTIRLVGAACALGGDHAAALAKVELPDPVSGAVKFGEDRQVVRKWELLTVTKEGIRPLSAPEAAPDGGN